MGGYFWEDGRVRLRAMTRSDCDIWLEGCLDSEVERTLGPGIELPKSPVDADEFYARYGEFRNQQERIMFSIDLLDGPHIGGMNICSVDSRNGTFSMGSRLYREFWGCGYFEEAKRIVLRYCFFELRLQKYNSGCIETNEAMVRHFARIGAVQEGRRRRVVFTNGRFYDELLYGLTNDEFETNDSEWKAARSFSVETA